MRFWKWIIGAVLVPGFVWAGPVQLGQISSEAKWVAHLDLTRLAGTQTGSWLYDQLNSEEAGTKFAAFQAVFNFDPRRDLDSITLFSGGEDPEKGVMLIHGRFDPQRLVTLVKANDSYGSSLYRNAVIHNWVDEKNVDSGVKSFGCVCPDGTVILSDQESLVRLALDVRDGVRPSLATGGSFTLPAPQDSAFFIAVADYASIRNVNPQAAMFQQAKTGAFWMGETAGIMEMVMALDAADSGTAQQLQMIAQGLVALMMLQAQQNPELAQLAQATRVQLEQTTVQMRASIPAPQLIRWMQEAEALKQATQAAPAP